MADTVKFPGTEMEVLEKYPDSFRLDHPNFGDVQKTTFAMGVITDFKKVQDDPLQVQSLVKVQVDGQELPDYIPLFYHPKSQYWDPDSKTLNQTGGYFEKAWMSFRGDDEVAVMLKEGKPVAVMGFADGKGPRIGEDIIKIVMPFINPVASNSLHLRMSTQELYGGLGVAANGPDGLDLGLTQAINPASNAYYYQDHPPLYPSTQGGQVDWVQNRGYGCIHTVRDYKRYYTEVFVPVGPLLYIFQIFWGDDYYFDEFCTSSGDDPGHIEPLGSVSGVWVNDGNTWVPVDPQPSGYPNSSRTLRFYGMRLRVGIYSQKLMDAIQSRGPYAPAEAYAQWDTDYIPLGTPYDNTFQQSWDVFTLLNGLFAWQDSPQWSGAEFFVRPHNG